LIPLGNHIRKIEALKFNNPVGLNNYREHDSRKKEVKTFKGA
jgi:hypothetical protein